MTAEIVSTTLPDSREIAVITATVMIASATLYSAIVWPSSRLPVALYACAKAKSFKKGSTSLRASRKVVPRLPGERRAATA